ncbi:MAG: ABC-F family ATP-binding cassette domain-containing protein [Prevotella sp.]|nr:ABC-F family ATP-binding cassette domain-containing protein [Prevotella sp.]
MIAVENLSVEFTDKPLFRGANFVVNNRDRIALVGKNGVGKSTLLKIIAGVQQPTSGSVNISGGESVGYLPQVMKLQDSTTVRDETKKAFLENETLTPPERWDGEAEKMLVGLGFTHSDLDRPTAEFSGGWRMRIELAKILLVRPDVLLLDEPTNHLDIESIQWLEQFLARSSKAVMLVSHDRAFINRVTNRTLEISCGKIIDYRVRYDEYVVLRQERRASQLRAYKNQQKEIADIREFIERFRYQATKANQVQQRIRQLEKIVPIEIDEVDTRSLHLHFPAAQRCGDFPLICDGVGKTYGEHNVFHDVNFSIRRGDKVAFVGKNGEGKTTLVKCIMNEIPFDGTLTVGHNVQIGYFAQNQAQLLDESLTVFETIDNVARGEMRLKIRDILGAFMFGGKESDKKVKVLSGGERSRLAMIRLLLEPVNFLILDEPTNHLDMDSKDVLKEAIKAFDGTVIIVSHDREFLDGLVEKVYEFGGGKVSEYLGGIYDFLVHKNMTSLDELSASPTTSHATKSSAVTEPKEDWKERKERNKRISRLERQIKESETRIEQTENRLAELDTILCTPEGASQIDLCSEYAQLRQALDKEMETWTALSEELDTLKQ